MDILYAIACLLVLAGIISLIPGYVSRIKTTKRMLKLLSRIEALLDGSTPKAGSLTYPAGHLVKLLTLNRVLYRLESR
jgi:hypothetical protein